MSATTSTFMSRLRLFLFIPLLAAASVACPGSNSNLEKRMMYFTESEDATEDPAKLNAEFEAEYDTGEYEAKISKLLHHAYGRIREENPTSACLWDKSIRCGVPRRLRLGRLQQF